MVAAVALLAISVPVHASKMDDRIESSAPKSYVFKTYLKSRTMILRSAIQTVGDDEASRFQKA